MNDLIHIKHNDNVYLLRNETPEYNELSIYVNEDNTRVSQSKCANPDGGKYRHVKVEWMYEKEKIAFHSSLMYIDIRILPTEPIQVIECEVNTVRMEMNDNTRAQMNWMEEWTREITNHLRIETDKEE